MCTKCSNCHRDIQRILWKISYNGDDFFFCSSECHDTWINDHTAQCFCCGRKLFLQNGIIRFNDGRISCSECFSTAVINDEQLLQCKRKVSCFFIEKYHYRPPCGVSQELCDDFVFQNKFSFISKDVLGVHGVVEKIKFSHCNIFILKGLTKQKTESTLAHELAHDMMYHTWKKRYSDDLRIVEGFARYIEYQYNIWANNQEVNNLLLMRPENYDKKTGDPYYDGLKLFLKIEKQGGYDGIKRYLEEKIIYRG